MTNEQKGHTIAMLKALTLVVAVAAGLAIAYIDTRPNFDDTGVLVLIILLASAGLAFMAGNRPWLISLAVGMWTPYGAESPKTRTNCPRGLRTENAPLITFSISSK